MLALITEGTFPIECVDTDMAFEMAQESFTLLSQIWFFTPLLFMSQADEEPFATKSPNAVNSRSWQTQVFFFGLFVRLSNFSMRSMIAKMEE